MNFRRTFALTKRALKQFRHDKRTLGFILIMPLLMILIFGYTFGGEVSNIKVTVVNLDRPASINAIDLSNITRTQTVTASMGKSLADHIDADALSVQPAPAAPDDARQQVRDGKIWAAIIIPQNFTREFLHGTLEVKVAFPGISFNTSAHGTVLVYVDGSNPNIAGAVMAKIGDALGKAIESFAQDNHIQMRKPAASLSVEYAYGSKDLRFIDYFAPGVMAFAVMMVTTMITIIVFVQERSTGTLSRLLASPATEGEIVVGYAAAFALIGMAQSLVVLSAAILIFDVSVAGNLLIAFLVVLLLAVGHQGLGIMLSAGARNELQAIQFIPLVLFPSILLAGLFWPVESIPGILRPLSNFIPLSYAIDALRSVMVRGWGIERILLDIGALAFFAALMLALSALLLRRKR